MKNKRSNTGFAVVVIILISLVILLTGYIVYDKVLGNKKDDNNSVETKKENKTDSNVDVDKIGKQLFEKYTDLVYYDGVGIFSSQNINYGSLDNSSRLVMALKNSKNIIFDQDDASDFYDKNHTVNDEGVFLDERVLSVKLNDFENSYRELFGESKSITYEKFRVLYPINSLSSTLLTCYKENSSVSCYMTEPACDLQSYFFDYDYSEYIDNKLYVYVNYLGVNDGGYGIGNLCSDYACNNIIDENEYDSSEVEKINELFEKYKDKTGVYKLVFNKDSNNNWYWEETQIVKK